MNRRRGRKLLVAIYEFEGKNYNFRVGAAALPERRKEPGNTFPSSCTGISPLVDLFNH